MDGYTPVGFDCLSIAADGSRALRCVLEATGAPACLCAPGASSAFSAVPLARALRPSRAAAPAPAPAPAPAAAPAASTQALLAACAWSPAGGVLGGLVADESCVLALACGARLALAARTAALLACRDAGLPGPAAQSARWDPRGLPSTSPWASLVLDASADAPREAFGAAAAGAAEAAAGAAADAAAGAAAAAAAAAADAPQQLPQAVFTALAWAPRLYRHCAGARSYLAAGTSRGALLLLRLSAFQPQLWRGDLPALPAAGQVNDGTLETLELGRSSCGSARGAVCSLAWLSASGGALAVGWEDGSVTLASITPSAPPPPPPPPATRASAGAAADAAAAALPASSSSWDRGVAVLHGRQLLAASVAVAGPAVNLRWCHGCLAVSRGAQLCLLWTGSSSSSSSSSAQQLGMEEEGEEEEGSAPSKASSPSLAPRWQTAPIPPLPLAAPPAPSAPSPAAPTHLDPSGLAIFNAHQGRITGIHLAALSRSQQPQPLPGAAAAAAPAAARVVAYTCGEDGAVRAWDVGSARVWARAGPSRAARLQQRVHAPRPCPIGGRAAPLLGLAGDALGLAVHSVAVELCQPGVHGTLPWPAAPAAASGLAQEEEGAGGPASSSSSSSSSSSAHLAAARSQAEGFVAQVLAQVEAVGSEVALEGPGVGVAPAAVEEEEAAGGCGSGGGGGSGGAGGSSVGREAEALCSVLLAAAGACVNRLRWEARGLAWRESVVGGGEAEAAGGAARRAAAPLLLAAKGARGSGSSSGKGGAVAPELQWCPPAAATGEQGEEGEEGEEGMAGQGSGAAAATAAAREAGAEGSAFALQHLFLQLQGGAPPAPLQLLAAALAASPHPTLCALESLFPLLVLQCVRNASACGGEGAGALRHLHLARCLCRHVLSAYAAAAAGARAESLSAAGEAAAVAAAAAAAAAAGGGGAASSAAAAPALPHQQQRCATAAAALPGGFTAQHGVAPGALGSLPLRWVWYAAAALPRVALVARGEAVARSVGGFAPGAFVPGPHKEAFLRAARWAAWAVTLGVGGAAGVLVAPFPPRLAQALRGVVAGTEVGGGAAGAARGVGGALPAAPAVAVALTAVTAAGEGEGGGGGGGAAQPLRPWSEPIPAQALLLQAAWAHAELALVPPPLYLALRALEACNL